MLWKLIGSVNSTMMKPMSIRALWESLSNHDFDSIPWCGMLIFYGIWHNFFACWDVRDLGQVFDIQPTILTLPTKVQRQEIYFLATILKFQTVLFFSAWVMHQTHVDSNSTLDLCVCAKWYRVAFSGAASLIKIGNDECVLRHELKNKLILVLSQWSVYKSQAPLSTWCKAHKHCAFCGEWEYKIWVGTQRIKAPTCKLIDRIWAKKNVLHFQI